MDIDQILTGLSEDNGFYKKAEVDAAIEQKEEIIPYLLKILEDVCKQPNIYTYRTIHSGYTGLFYTLMLLAYFNEPKAHDWIVKIACLPEETVSPLLEDVITERLPAMLLQTCNGSLARIKDVALNKKAYIYCRTAAIDAIESAVFEEICSREEALEFYKNILLDPEPEEDDYIYGATVMSILDLYPEELMEVIRETFSKDRVDRFLVTLEEFEKSLHKDKTAWLEQSQKTQQFRRIQDIQSSMRPWFDFKERPHKSSSKEGKGFGEVPLKSKSKKKKK